MTSDPKYRVSYSHGAQGYWRYDIVPVGQQVPVVSGVSDKDNPYSPYAAERVARELCAQMNEAAAGKVTA